MRVLHVLSSIHPKHGGPSWSLQGLACAQAKAGCDVTVVSTFTEPFDPAIENLLKAHGVKVKLVGPSRGILQRHLLLASVVEELVASCDVCHIHALWEEIQHLAARAAQRMNKPYVIKACAMIMTHGLSTHKWQKKLLLAWRVKKNLLNARAIHFCSQYERKESIPLKVRSIVEPNGIELSVFDPLPPKNSFRTLHPQLENKPFIIYVGRIHPDKGLGHLIHALAECRQRDLRLVIVGPNPTNYKATLEKLAAENGTLERILFVGELYGQQKIAALADADLFCLASDSESFSVAAIEALASGTPVLLSDRVGVAEELAAAGVGVTVSRRPDEIAAAIDQWISDSSMREAAAARARPWVWKNYDWNTIAARWVAHYQSMIDGKSLLPILAVP